MHGAAHKMDKPPAHKISLRFSRRGEKEQPEWRKNANDKRRKKPKPTKANSNGRKKCVQPTGG